MKMAELLQIIGTESLLAVDSTPIFISLQSRCRGQVLLEF